MGSYPDHDEMRSMLLDIADGVREPLDDKSTAGYTRIVWDGSNIQELAPWEPFYGFGVYRMNNG